jgi:hypothetical protein
VLRGRACGSGAMPISTSDPRAAARGLGETQTKRSIHPKPAGGNRRVGPRSRCQARAGLQ